MPLPTDENLLKLSNDIVAVLDKTSGGEHPGYRAAHARGILLRGTFTPTTAAAQLSSAPHFAPGSTTPVAARFSSSTGLPRIPDSDPNAQPRGLAVRFELGPHQHTDIVAHSTDGFPVRTGEEFRALFEAIAAGPAAVAPFLAAHPAAAAFVGAPKPCPASFATEAYFALSAYKFVPSGRFARYSFVPKGGVHHLDAEAVKGHSSFLYDELAARLQRETVDLELWAQLTDAGDVTDDVTVRWPAERERVLLGTLALDRIAERNAEEQKHIIFDPVPRVQGIEPSADPLLDVRAAVYLVSGRRRRAASLVE
ncbi:catalase related protein [Auricularia subglabra TFB-10046 SS5]|nr:catalase related protein [Auricularia subglabra TFB-10046 SS5]